MFPDWFEYESWKLLVEGTGETSALLVKFKIDPLDKFYDIYMTDFASIWHEHADEALIESQLQVRLE